MADANLTTQDTSTRVRNRRVFDAIVKHVDRYKTARFDDNIRRLKRDRPRRLNPWNDDEFLRQLADITAAQAVRSTQIERLDETTWREAFANFRLGAVASLKPEQVKRAYWRKGRKDGLSLIRLPEKIDRIIDSAKVLQVISGEFGEFGAYLNQYQIPPRIRKDRDVDDFWAAVDELRADMERRRMPSLWRWPSLLHFLMEYMGYDCTKPDAIAMRVGYVAGIVPNSDGERNRRQMARAVQYYSLDRGIRPIVVDNYLMCFGNQSAFEGYTVNGFACCGSEERCTNADCPVGEKGLCVIRAVT